MNGKGMANAYLQSVEQVARDLTTDAGRGLTAHEAAARAKIYGLNELQEKAQRGPWRIFAGQFSDFLIVVLVAAAVISGIVGELADTIAIMVIIVLNAVVGFVQEFRAERAIAMLRKMAAASATVVRDGEARVVAAAQLVPGDVVMLEAGNVVPADMRLVEASQLRVEEAALTGESVPAEKNSHTLRHAGMPLGDRHNMAFKGTIVSYGRGRGIVTASGMNTELGRIASRLSGDEDLKTPLQKRLAHFGRVLALAVLAICAIIFAIGMLRGEPPVLMFLTAVSLAVAAIPEALPAVITISLALGARRMVEHRALIRRLPAVETLGSVTMICADKTGTLTQNSMHVEVLYVDGELGGAHAAGPGPDTPAAQLLRAMAISNDAMLDHNGAVIGDPTEAALFKAAQKAGFDKAALTETLPRVEELPFDSTRKRMTTFHRTADGLLAYTKGAPERLLPQCVSVMTSRGVGVVDREQVLAEAERMAQAGLRVIALAYRQWPGLPQDLDPESVESGLVFLGLVGMMDPPRDNAAQSVALCKSAGITPVMITGDHPATARAIARRIGIADGNDAVVTGRMLSHYEPDKLRQSAAHTRIYARVDPEQKIDIVTALQARGEVVAMTGDGVNDAPALKQADIGVAMGKGGTDVAREASHMILLDDNFATIVEAVAEGRRIFDNIRKFIRYTMTSNSGEIWVLFLAPFLFLPVPLLPIHILWINLVTDGLPGLALAVEPAERGIMARPPRPPRETIFSGGMWQHILWVGLLIGGLSLLAQAWAYNNGQAHWQTMVFTVLAFAQMFHVLSIRSERDSLFTIGMTSNLPLLGAVLLTFALQAATIYVPFLNGIFKTQPLSAAEFASCVALGSVVFFAVEAEKWMIRRGWIQFAPAQSS